MATAVAPRTFERVATPPPMLMAMASLSAAGHEWRREQASALQGEHISINRIAALFGVTRQRISALLRETDADRSPDAEGE